MTTAEQLSANIYRCTIDAGIEQKRDRSVLEIEIGT